MLVVITSTRHRAAEGGRWIDVGERYSQPGTRRFHVPGYEQPRALPGRPTTTIALTDFEAFVRTCEASE